MTQQCDTFTALTMSAPAESGFAWSECDGEPFYQDYAGEPYDDELDDGEPSSWWAWAFVIVVSAAGALAIAIVVGRAFVALTPEAPSPAPHSSTVGPSTSPDAFIGSRWAGEPAQNT